MARDRKSPAYRHDLPPSDFGLVVEATLVDETSSRDDTHDPKPQSRLSAKQLLECLIERARNSAARELGAKRGRLTLEEDVERDADQVALLRAFLAIEDGKAVDIPNRSAWFEKVKKHAKIDGMRALIRHASVPIGEDIHPHVQPCDPEAEWEAERKSGAVREAVAGLDPASHTIIDLVYYQGLSLRKIARRVGVCSSTMTERHRAALDLFFDLFVVAMRRRDGSGNIDENSRAIDGLPR